MLITKPRNASGTNELILNLGLISQHTHEKPGRGSVQIAYGRRLKEASLLCRPMVNLAASGHFGEQGMTGLLLRHASFSL